MPNPRSRNRYARAIPVPARSPSGGYLPAPGHRVPRGPCEHPGACAGARRRRSRADRRRRRPSDGRAGHARTHLAGRGRDEPARLVALPPRSRRAGALCPSRGGRRRPGAGAPWHAGSLPKMAQRRRGWPKEGRRCARPRDHRWRRRFAGAGDRRERPSDDGRLFGGAARQRHVARPDRTHRRPPVAARRDHPRARSRRRTWGASWGTRRVA